MGISVDFWSRKLFKWNYIWRGDKKEGERASTGFRIRMFGGEGTLSTVIKGTEGEAGADQGPQPWRDKGQRVAEPASIRA